VNSRSKRLNSKIIAFVVIMSAVANVLGFMAVPIGAMSIHFMQLPIILTGLSLGPLAGGSVGFVGAIVMALTTPKGVNLYILPGNAILGFFTGLFYSRLRKIAKRPIVPQLASVLLAFIIQAPYTYVTDVYLMSMPSLIVQVLLIMLFIEDLISVLICHFILYRVNIAEILR